MFNVLQLQSMLKPEAPKATLTHFLLSKPQLQKSTASDPLQNSVSTPKPRLLFPLCPLYLQCIVNTVNANMALQDKKQLWTEVKHWDVVCMTCSWLETFQRCGSSCCDCFWWFYICPAKKENKKSSHVRLDFFFCKLMFFCPFDTLILLPVDYLGLAKAQSIYKRTVSFIRWQQPVFIHVRCSIFLVVWHL